MLSHLPAVGYRPLGALGHIGSSRMTNPGSCIPTVPENYENIIRRLTIVDRHNSLAYFRRRPPPTSYARREARP